MKTVMAIAAGGALGAVARHYVVHWVALSAGTSFPWGILSVNVIGSFIMGVLVEAMTLFWTPSLELRAFLTVGLLGAFTTFSSFSLDVAILHGRGELFLAFLYIVGSVAAAVAGLFAGMHLTRAIFG